MSASEPIRYKHKLRQLAGYFLQRGQLRNYALIILGVYTALRISDLLHLTWNDVYDEKNGEYYSHIAGRQGQGVFKYDAVLRICCAIL